MESCVTMSVTNRHAQLQSFLFHQLLKLLHQVILNFLQAEHAYFLNL